MIEIGPQTKKKMSYDDAWLYCLTLTHNGYKDWRLPKILEYSSSSDFRLCWYEGDEYAGERHWHTVPVRDVND